MRLVGALLLLGLTGPIAFADDVKPADPKPEAAPAAKKRVPFRVVRMLPETRQVLLYNKTKGSHVVAEVGQTVEGFIIDEIDDDEVTLISETGAEVILTAPDLSWRRRAAERKAGKDSKAAAINDPAPVDPYADVAPVDPYADSAASDVAPREASALGEGGVRVASAAGASGDTASAESTDPYADPAISAFVAAVGSASAPAKAPAKSTTKPGKPGSSAATGADAAALAAAVTGTPATTATPPAASAETTMLSRTEVNAALGDFGRLSSSFRAAFTPEGVRFDAVSDGSLLAKVGLRKGDVITSIDGRPLKSIDDAANLYARASTTKSSTIQVVRAGNPVTLRIAIQ